MTNTPGKKPSHIAYKVKESNGKSFYTAIGAAWMHNDGKGFSLKLDSYPTDGNISIRERLERK